MTVNSSAGLEEFRILLVEDDDDHADLVTRSLQNCKLHLALNRVRDGAQALTYLKGQSITYPNLILLDLKLPDMEGHDVLEAIKDNKRLSMIPVVVLTTSHASIDLIKAYNRHVNSYLVKPLDFDQFNTMMIRLVEYWGFINKTVESDMISRL